MDYDFSKIEKKWQEKWKKEKPFKAVDFSAKPKYYILTEFFGPSGKGIHLGHIKAYTPTEVVARFMRLKGYNVLYPVGWDAFGLPTENYSLKMGISPKKATIDSIKIFTNQLERMGYSFDWDREIDTTDPDYYKWTQWIFLQLFNKGKAYKAIGKVNFCEKCQTTLSNEDSQGGVCDRCKCSVVELERTVWYLKMQEYSEKMLKAIDEIKLKESLKEAQRNWIGKSIGAEIDFKIVGSKSKLKVFTTRPDTIYGVSYMAVAPEHPLAQKAKNKTEVLEYIKAASQKSSIDRAAAKDKSGVKLEGVFAISPVNGEEIPVFAADYIMMDYGTGAIMAVPAHDERDMQFAKKYGLSIVEVFSKDGLAINSPAINGLTSEKAKEKIVEYLGTAAKKKVNYKMQDWPFNRQRYWGEPFPIVDCTKCGLVALKNSDLPLVLPDITDYTPDEFGNGPLSKADKWINTTCPKCGEPAKFESDTMPNWAGSSWYWLRFLDPKNKSEFVSKKLLDYWGAVDLYSGGTEHITRHMLYASFWHNFLYDNKLVPFRLPFIRRMCNGLILDEKGKKMGKSSGNAVDPISIIDQYGADAFRLHILFIGEYEQNTVWTLDGINGVVSFIKRVWGLQNIIKDDKVSSENERELNILIKKADTGILEFKFNTIIAACMEFYNHIKKIGFITKDELKAFLLVLNPFMPHITAEIFENVFSENILDEKFPTYDESKLALKQIELPIQVAGKFKGTILVDAEEKASSIEKKALKFLGVKAAKKIIFVPNKIINIIF